jgi:thioredoxin 1
VSEVDLEFVGDADWEATVLNADVPVLVEFWSPTCDVCRTMEVRLQRVVESYGDRVSFFRVNVKVEEDLVWAYDVLSTPTFIAFRDTEPVGALFGEVDGTEIGNLLDDALAGE